MASAAAALYLLDGGVVEGATWEPQRHAATSPPQAIGIVGRGTSAWNPELCAPAPKHSERPWGHRLAIAVS